MLDGKHMGHSSARPQSLQTEVKREPKQRQRAESHREWQKGQKIDNSESQDCPLLLFCVKVREEENVLLSFPRARLKPESHFLNEEGFQSLLSWEA